MLGEIERERMQYESEKMEKIESERGIKVHAVRLCKD